MEKSKTLPLKVKKPTRMLSGVSVVAIMAKPYPCPHGSCVYCPGGVSEGTPQSYVLESPAVMRAIRHNYNPYKQVISRLKQYEILGHRPSKIELIVMGGTFPAMPKEYQEWFVANAFEALNRYPAEDPPSHVNLELAHLRNERAKIRCVGLTIETRPDWSMERHVDWFLHLGATRIELGVQTVFDDVLKKVRRGHTVEDSIKATQILKDSGYKVVYHLMLALPGMDPDRDLEAAKEIFENPDFRPDQLKIYPTLVVPGTVLYKWWKEGKYEPYPEDVLVELIAKIKSIVPPYVRIIRVNRDIPSQYIVAGPKKANLREIVWNYMKNRGLKCRCIRCREAGRVAVRTGIRPSLERARIFRLNYEASGGLEIFLSYEDPVLDALFGFIRLRIPSEKAHRWEMKGRVAVIRELHVYGPEIPVGERGEGWQHRGIGSRLLKEAERIARDEFDIKRLYVISGVGVREYYYKKGYKRLKNSFYVYKDL